MITLDDANSDKVHSIKFHEFVETVVVALESFRI